ncbi:TPA: hypothetical protein N0F65_012103 [Lagenidium giganteum]|uniref:Uncharacterized protein n=1 Tax=Lagenidium giganteum TaxID=4803 RepID=A0AAV2YTC1_9STRA|nr:TPA: hypothetical protein N0F65_012103 [Lagenidium giganteum]
MDTEEAQDNGAQQHAGEGSSEPDAAQAAGESSESASPTTTNPTNDADAAKPQFSQLQVDAKVRMARLDARKELDAELLQLQQRIVELEHECQAARASQSDLSDRFRLLQEGVASIVQEHERTLVGMKETLQVEKLVATLDTETSAKEALRVALEQQNKELLTAQSRIQALGQQIQKYQKTETVLAQSISHFQHRASTKDHQRAATIERLKQEMEESHRAATTAIQQELEQTKQSNDSLQEALTALQGEHLGLQQSARAVLKDKERSDALEQQLEREKAMLASKAEQLQKTDAQLRSKAHTQAEELNALVQQNELLREENKELTKIATDLMEISEKQQAEKERRQQATPPRPLDGGEPQSARKRQRRSVG